YPTGNQHDAVGSINPPSYGVNPTNDDNQNNAFLNSPVPTTSQPVPPSDFQSDFQDPVRSMVIALPGPGVNIPKNPGSCAPLDVNQEIGGLDTTSSITENSDLEWVDQRNKEMQYHSISLNSISVSSD
ncbi:unnamed protein product, partial [Rodentolepis nana]|uniref:Tensin 3 n=1 Tax=Rodentolepis nana TaxID=102285 RepID=A0A0R3TCM3_RODNA